MARFDPAHWDRYNAAQDGRQVRDLCLRVMALAGPGEGRAALDLGCGAGVETAALLADGWQVMAVDPAPATTEALARTVPPASTGRLEVHVTGIETFEVPPVDLVHAAYALPFVGPGRLTRTWERLCAAVRPGGWLAVNLFGTDDSWAADPSMTEKIAFLDRVQVEDMLSGWEVLELVEQRDDGGSFGGPKHWHTFDVLARR